MQVRCQVWNKTLFGALKREDGDTEMMRCCEAQGNIIISETDCSLDSCPDVIYDCLNFEALISAIIRTVAPLCFHLANNYSELQGNKTQSAL